MTILQDKVAVIYGAAGAIGGAVAREFAAEGASVCLTGRSKAPLEALAREIVAAGGRAEAAVVDALDEPAIERQLQSLVERSGRLDIMFNAIGVPETQVLGVPLLELELERFLLPIQSYTRSYFLTARLAARHMLPRKSGVIMSVSALPARSGTRLNGGYGPANAAKEAMARDLSAELAPQGLRVVNLRPHGMPETGTMREVFDIKASAMGGLSWEQFTGYLAGTTHPRRVMVLKEVGAMAAFIASDKASGMTGTTVNMTMGALDD